MRRPVSGSASPAQRISLSGENVTPRAGAAEPDLTSPEQEICVPWRRPSARVTLR
jgi:hypothetical protein